MAAYRPLLAALTEAGCLMYSTRSAAAAVISFLILHIAITYHWGIVLVTF